MSSRFLLQDVVETYDDLLLEDVGDDPIIDDDGPLSVPMVSDPTPDDTGVTPVVDDVVLGSGRGKYRSIPNDIRQSAIRMYQRGVATKTICSYLNLKPSTYRSIISVYNKEGRTDKKMRGGNNPSILPEYIIDLLLDKVDDDCTQRLEDLQLWLEKDHGIVVCLKTISRYLLTFHYSIKLIKVISSRVLDSDVQAARLQYGAAMDTILLDSTREIIFLDETGFTASMRVKRGRSSEGERPIMATSSIRSRNHSMAAAISREGLVYYRVQETAYNSTGFCAFLSDLFAKLQELGKHNCLIVMDNVRFHKTAENIAVVRGHGHEIMWLPAYSPELNPIEKVFAQWKAIVRRLSPRNELAMYEAIDIAASQITSAQCENYYRNMERNVARARRGEVLEN